MHAADLIIEKLQDHVKSLINMKYPEIKEIIDTEGEIKLSFSATITDRETEPGEHAEKSDRVKTVLSFSIRSTAMIESQLNEHPELFDGEGNAKPPYPLNGPVHTPLPETDEEGHGIASDANLSSPGAEDAGTTPLGDVLDQTAATQEQPLLNINLNEQGWNVGGLRTEFRVKAGKAKWIKPAISLIIDLLDKCEGNVERAKDILRPHTIAGQTPEAAPATEPETVGA